MTSSLATLFVSLFTIFHLVSTNETPHPLSDEFINLINSKQDLWQAGRNFPKDTSMSYIRQLMGTILGKKPENLPVRTYDAAVYATLPDHFDAREHWPSCPSLKEIRDQGGCGSCWATSVSEAMTDRICIISNATKNTHISTEDILTCCHECGDGCAGGMPIFAWQFWVDEGVVSGGNYGSKKGCKPYSFLPCEHHMPGKRPSCQKLPTPPCIKHCRSGYNVSYAADKSYGKNVITVKPTEIDIRSEIFLNGPVSADFMVYEDFLNYKKGIYKHTKGEFLGGHAVKLLGWGEENGVQYWLVANSWNTDWGEKGFFRILRSENHCNIEHEVFAAEPK